MDQMAMRCIKIVWKDDAAKDGLERCLWSLDGYQKAGFKKKYAVARFDSAVMAQKALESEIFDRDMYSVTYLGGVMKMAPGLQTPQTNSSKMNTAMAPDNTRAPNTAPVSIIAPSVVRTPRTLPTLSILAPKTVDVMPHPKNNSKSTISSLDEASEKEAQQKNDSNISYVEVDKVLSAEETKEKPSIKPTTERNRSSSDDEFASPVTKLKEEKQLHLKGLSSAKGNIRFVLNDIASPVDDTVQRGLTRSTLDFGDDEEDNFDLRGEPRETHTTKQVSENLKDENLEYKDKLLDEKDEKIHSLQTYIRQLEGERVIREREREDFEFEVETTFKTMEIEKEALKDIITRQNVDLKRAQDDTRHLVANSKHYWSDQRGLKEVREALISMTKILRTDNKTNLYDKSYSPPLFRFHFVNESDNGVPSHPMDSLQFVSKSLNRRLAWSQNELVSVGKSLGKRKF